MALFDLLSGDDYILKGLATPASFSNPSGEAGISMAANPVLSFDLRVPLGIQALGNFGLEILGTGCGKSVYVRLLTLKPATAGCCYIDRAPSGMYDFAPIVTIAQGEELEVKVLLGEGFFEGSWHTIQIDIPDTVNRAVKEKGLDPNAWCIERANGIKVDGRMFRMDNIMFRPDYCIGDLEYFYLFYLFDMGPLYARIFEPCRYLFIADYKGKGIKVRSRGKETEIIRVTDLLLDPNNFITDPKQDK